MRVGIGGAVVTVLMHLHCLARLFVGNKRCAIGGLSQLLHAAEPSMLQPHTQLAV
jgi:hypothetical protein